MTNSKNVVSKSIVTDSKLEEIDGLISTIDKSINEDCSLSVSSKSVLENLLKKRKERTYYLDVLQKGFDDLFKKLDAGIEPPVVLNMLKSLFKTAMLLQDEVDCNIVIRKLYESGYIIDNRMELANVKNSISDLSAKYKTTKNKDCQKQLARCILTAFLINELSGDDEFIDSMLNDNLSVMDEFIRFA